MRGRVPVLEGEGDGAWEARREVVKLRERGREKDAHPFTYTPNTSQGQGKRAGMYFGSSHRDVLEQGQQQRVLAGQRRVGAAVVVDEVELPRVRAAEALHDVLLFCVVVVGFGGGSEGGERGDGLLGMDGDVRG